MTKTYRVHYKKGDTDIEVESTDKDYVDAMLAKLISASPGRSCENIATKSHKQISSNLVAGAKEAADNKAPVEVARVAARIHDADNFSNIEKNVLDKSAQLPRVLLVLKFAQDAGYPWLTTGDIEAVTNELNVKMSTANISNCISSNRSFFTSDSVRRKGAKVPYKINRHGMAALDNFISGEKS